MEAFSTQTKPTIKTDDLFTIQTNHFTIKTQQLQTQQLLTIKNPPSSYDFLPSNPTSSVKTNLLWSKPTTFYLQNRRLNIIKTNYQNLLKIYQYRKITIKTKPNHKWCFKCLYRLLPWKNFFLAFNLRLSFLKCTSNPKGWKLSTTAEHCTLPSKYLTENNALE